MLFTIVGALCECTRGKMATIDIRSCLTNKLFMEFVQRNIKCQVGAGGSVRWTPDENTPDIVYYQVCSYNN